MKQTGNPDFSGKSYEFRPYWPYSPLNITPGNGQGAYLWVVPKDALVYCPLVNTLCRGVYIHSDSVRSIDRWLGFMPNVYNAGATTGAIDSLTSIVYWGTVIDDGSTTRFNTMYPYNSGGKDVMVSSARTDDTPCYLITNRRLNFDFWAPRSLNVYCRAQKYGTNQPGDNPHPKDPPIIGYSPQMDVSEWGNLGPVDEAHTLRVYYSSIATYATTYEIPNLNEYILSSCDLDIDYMFQVKLYRDVP